jgi:nuclear transport factor 2 (NTF2) superfamily protein
MLSRAPACCSCASLLFPAAFGAARARAVDETWNGNQAALAALAHTEDAIHQSARLEEAVTAYRDALKEMTREREPLQWAATRNNLGRV